MFQPKYSSQSITEKIGDKPVRNENIILSYHERRKSNAGSTKKMRILIGNICR